MDTRHIPTREWTTFLRAFAREHADWEVTVEVERVRGLAPRRERVMDDVRLREMRIEESERETNLIVRMAAGAREVRHVVAEPTILSFTELCTGPAALQIDAPGCRTRIYVRPFDRVVFAPEEDERYWHESSLFEVDVCEIAGSRGARVAKQRAHVHNTERSSHA